MEALEKNTIKSIILGQDKHGKTSLLVALTDLLSKKGIVPNVKVGNTPYLNRDILIAKWQIDETSYIMVDSSKKNIKPDDLKIFDMAILVVDAYEGIMPQTRDYVLKIRQSGMSNVVVFVNKCDLVANFKTDGISTLMASYGFVDVPIIMGSALEYDNVPKYEMSIFRLIDTIRDLNLKQKEEKFFKTK